MVNEFCSFSSGAPIADLLSEPAVVISGALDSVC